MRTETINIYTYNELSEEAKAKARDWYRSLGLDHAWWNSVYDDAKEIGELMGIAIKDIGFSGFASQGDGAHFTGTFGYAKGCAQNVALHAPQDTALHSIAQQWQNLQSRHFYKLNGTVTHQGHYQHAYCTGFDIYSGSAYVADDVDDEVKSILREFMGWIYNRLEKESEYLESDENIAESIVASEHEFLATGKHV